MNEYEGWLKMNEWIECINKKNKSEWISIDERMKIIKCIRENK